MRKAVFAAVLALAMSTMIVGSGVATAFHGTAACNSSGTTLQDGVPRADSVNPGGSKWYKVTVPSGKAGDVVMWAAGDADMYICNVSSDKDYCLSNLIAAAPEACTVGGWDLESKQLTPGTYGVKVEFCFDTACGYDADFPGPVNYAITFKTV